MPKVSIIIPIYNLQKYLEECLESVVNQTYKNLEILLIDDGSQDESLKICRNYAAKDKRIRVFTQENHGVSYTRNRGIKSAMGDYLMFVDGDDWLDLFWVEHYVVCVKESQADIVVGGLTFLMQDGELQKKRLPAFGDFGKEFWNYICEEESGIFGYAPNKLYSAQLIQKNEIYYNEMMSAQEDLDFALSSYGKSQKVSFIDEFGYIYRYMPGKRQHPLLQYMQNQLKMLELARAQTTLNKNAEIKVVERIQGLLYCYLYYLPINSSFVCQCKKLEKQEGLQTCMEEYQGKGEVWIVSKLVLYKRYNMLKVYFCIRHTLRVSLNLLK